MTKKHAVAAALIGLATALTLAAIGGVALSRDGEAAADRDSSHAVPGTAKVHRKVEADGGTWSFESFRNARGERCSTQRVPGEGAGISCHDRAELLARRDTEVVAFPGARQRSANHRKVAWDNLWINGFVSPKVTQLEIVNTDCSVDRIAFDAEGAFMHVVGTAQIRRGVVPHRLVARNAAGTVVHDQEVGVGVPPNGRSAGLEPPRPEAACR